MNKMCLMLMLGVASCTTKEHKAQVYEPYEPFGVVVEETTWNGKLQPGRYTKSGILIIKK